MKIFISYKYVSQYIYLANWPHGQLSLMDHRKVRQGKGPHRLQRLRGKQGVQGQPGKDLSAGMERRKKVKLSSMKMPCSHFSLRTFCR